MGEVFTEGLEWSWDLRVVGDEEEAFVRMDPACGDECVKKIGDDVRGLEVKCVFVKDKRYWGEKEESDGRQRVVWLVRWGCVLGAEDRNLEVFGIGDAGVVKKLNRNPVDSYERWRKR